MGQGKFRNLPCWCKSGRKYKNCHLTRGDTPPPNMEEILAETRRVSDRKECLHPDKSSGQCAGDIVRAHSIQRALLERIAKSGRVIQWDSNIASIARNNGKTSAKLKGIGAASTFNGFCSLHDDRTFAPIEKQPIRPTSEHAFLLSYRAVVRECFAKTSQHSLIPFTKTLDRGKDLPSQVFHQDTMSIYAEGVELGKRDIEHHKARHDAILVGGTFGADVHSYWMILDRQPDFACTGGIYPEFDFQGNQIQDLAAENTLDLLTFSVLPGTASGLVVFSWVGESPACTAFVNSLLALSAAEVPHAVTRFAVEFYENVCLSPDWWDGLSVSDQGRLLQRAHAAASLTLARSSDCLLDDGLRIARWSVVNQVDLR